LISQRYDAGTELARVAATMTLTTTRRSVLGAIGATIVTACQKNEAAKSAPAAPVAADPPAGASASVPMRRLGRTGQQVSLVGLGGFHLGKPSEEEAIQIIRRAIDSGVTFLDNCWDYNDGASEERMGKALQDGYRQRAFLMTKIDGRTSRAAGEQIEQSLRRLKTERVDLMQIHEVIRPGDPERCFAPGGVVETLVAAQKAGKIRYIGFTGHKDPDYHLAMIEKGLERGFTFDTVQLPLNVMDAHYKSFEKKVLPVLVKHDIGVLGMKSLGSGDILKSKAASAVECLHYAMNLPTSVVITGCDSLEVLDQAVKAARDFQPLPKEKVERLLARTEPFAREGKFELFKTSEKYDGTARNPHWLEEARL
jgi:aryl-alcohol dehydrogenase-like predicted oxidoreductase